MESNEVDTEQHGVINQAKAQLAKLDDFTNQKAGTSRKSNTKSNVTAAEARPADPAKQADFVSKIKQAQKATDKAKTKEEQAATDIFQLHANILSVNVNYVWNKIVHKQTTSDSYTDLQGCSKKGRRGLSCKSFDHCIMFLLLTMFPNNAAEQQQYYITNMLKKPQCVSISQFVQHVASNSYIMQLPC
jgi:hypothetical protein